MTVKLGKGRGSGYEIDMTNGPLLGKIVRFAIPLAISGILQLLFNAADMIVVGRFAGANALAAVGATGALINLIVTLFMGLSVGTNVLVAQYYGGDHQKDLSETVHTSILASLLFGVVLIGIGMVLARPILTAMATPADVLDQAVLYMRIYFIGMPVMMLYNFGAAILRAVGDTQRPLYFLVIAGVVNVVLNLFFVIVLHMDVAGVATATDISQAVSALLVLRCLIKTDGPYQVDLRRLTIKKDKLIRRVKIGLPAGIQGASFSISNVLIQSSINSFGSMAMAGNTAAANIEGFVGMGVDAFSQAALSFTGQNMGAGKPERIRKIILLCMGMGMGVGLVLGVGCRLAGPQLLGFYTEDPQVIDYGLRRMNYVCVLQCVAATMGVMVGVLRGMGSSIAPMAITMTFVCGFRVVWLFTVFAAAPSLEMLYISYPITWALAAFCDLLFYFHLKRKLKLRRHGNESLAAGA